MTDEYLGLLPAEQIRIVEQITKRWSADRLREQGRPNYHQGAADIYCLLAALDALRVWTRAKERDHKLALESERRLQRDKMQRLTWEVQQLADKYSPINE